MANRLCSSLPCVVRDTTLIAEISALAADITERIAASDGAGPPGAAPVFRCRER